MTQVASNETMQLRLDTFTCESLDAYAMRMFPRPNGEGNRTEAVRQILLAIFKLEELPAVQELFKNNLILNGDILVLFRHMISDRLQENEGNFTQFILK